MNNQHENNPDKDQRRSDQESSCSSEASTSHSLRKSSNRGETTSLSAVLAELNLTQFLEGFISEGFVTSVDLAGISTSQAEQVCGNVGMKIGHSLRFCRWVREQHSGVSLDVHASQLLGAAEEGPSEEAEGSPPGEELEVSRAFEAQSSTLATRLEAWMRCPITQEPMADPVVTHDGQSYERSAIEQWFNSGKVTSPATGATLTHQNLVPEFALRGAIHEAFPEARERFEAILQAKIMSQLCIAIRDNRLGRVEELLLAGATVNQTTDDGMTPLTIAVYRGHTKVVGLLLGGGADANQARTEDGATPLYMAAHMGHVKVVSLLLEGGADTNQARTNNGATPLYIAAENGHSDVASLLLESGANANQARADIGATPLFIAAQKGHVKVVDILLGSGANLEQEIFPGWTPLFVSAWSGHAGAVGLLLQAGAIMGATTTAAHLGVAAGSTPLEIATEMGHIAVINALRGAASKVGC